MSLQTRLSDLITAIGTDYKQLRTWITGSTTGDLTGLTTTAKSSLVAAINEVDAGASPPAASATVPGIVELAIDSEMTTGTDTVRAATPANVRFITGALASLTTTVKTTLVGAINEVNAKTPPVGSETVVGAVELATLPEVATGTDATRVVTVAGVRQERTALKAEILGPGVPAALDTLDELAAALADDAAFSATITTALANRVRIDTAAAGYTALQQQNARTNILVYSQAEMGNPETDLVAAYTTAKA